MFFIPNLRSVSNVLVAYQRSASNIFGGYSQICQSCLLQLSKDQSAMFWYLTKDVLVANQRLARLDAHISFSYVFFGSWPQISQHCLLWLSNDHLMRSLVAIRISASNFFGSCPQISMQCLLWLSTDQSAMSLMDIHRSVSNVFGGMHRIVHNVFGSIIHRSDRNVFVGYPQISQQCLW